MPIEVRGRAHAAVGHGRADLALLLAERQVLVFGEQRVDVRPNARRRRRRARSR